MIYTLFSSWGPKHFPSSIRISDIAIFVWVFSPHNGYYRPNTHTHIRNQKAAQNNDG